MFNTIYAENFYKKWLFGQKTDVYFEPFQKKQHMWFQNGDKDLSKNIDILLLMRNIFQNCFGKPSLDLFLNISCFLACKVMKTLA
jgi:hypothetical protein